MTGHMVTHLKVVSIKGKGTADQGVQDNPQAPYIHLGTIVLLSLEEFRCGVGWAATECVQFVSWGELIAEAKVSNLDVHVGVKEKVLRLIQREE